MMGTRKDLEAWLLNWSRTHHAGFSAVQVKTLALFRECDSFQELAQKTTGTDFLSDEQKDGISIFFNICTIEDIHDYVGGRGPLPKWYDFILQHHWVMDLKIISV